MMLLHDKPIVVNTTANAGNKKAGCGIMLTTKDGR